MRRLLAAAAIAASVVAARDVAAQSPRVETGRLVKPAVTDAKGRQEYSFDAAAGQRIEVRLSSDDFDTLLELIPPAGDPFYREPLSNDDYGSSTDSRITAIASAGGTWRAVATSFEPGEGQFELQIDLGETGRIESFPPRALSDSDSLSMKGRRYAVQTITLREDAQLVVEMISADFDPQLIVIAPSGARYTSEMEEGNTARVEVNAAEAGRWRVIATQLATDEPAGSYALRVIEIPSAAGDALNGALDESDLRDVEGELYDEHRIPGSTDRPLVIQLASTDFDAFLAARSPSGEWFRDDDGGGETDARLELPPIAGTWLVVVTSFSEGERGRYRLIIGR